MRYKAAVLYNGNGIAIFKYREKLGFISLFFIICFVR